MLENPKDWFLLTLLALFIATAISWICFARLTMGKIERTIKSKDAGNQFEWDGIGIRIVFYAYAIVLPERYALHLEKRLVHSTSVRSHANQADRISGLFFLISSNLFVLACLTGWFIWG